MANKKLMASFILSELVDKSTKTSKYRVEWEAPSLRLEISRHSAIRILLSNGRLVQITKEVAPQVWFNCGNVILYLKGSSGYTFRDTSIDAFFYFIELYHQNKRDFDKVLLKEVVPTSSLTFSNNKIYHIF